MSSSRGWKQKQVYIMPNNCGVNEQLGLDLAISNQVNVLNSINNFKNKLNILESLIKEKNWELLSNKLAEAKEIRHNFIN